MSKRIIAFPRRSEFEKALGRLEALSLPHEVISPEPGFRLVGAPSLVLDADVWHELAAEASSENDTAGGAAEHFVCSGEVEYRPTSTDVPSEPPDEFEEDVMGECAVMVLAPCTSGHDKIRATAHCSGDLSGVFPSLNADMLNGSYNQHRQTFTFMEEYRVISLYSHRIAIAKADDIVDVWRVLEDIRVRVNDVWSRREEIEPSYEMRQRPPAIEIYKRLPRTNCRQCGEGSCLAFATKVWNGELEVTLCKPVFDPAVDDQQDDYSYLKGALEQVCSGLRVDDAGDEGGG